MSTRDNPQAVQLGFDALLIDGESANLMRQIEGDCAHLPSTYNDALPFFRELLHNHHAAMVEGDAQAALALRNEADLLATKLNQYDAGILAGRDAPGCVLERVTQAPKGSVPLWGQSGSFEIVAAGMRLRIAMEGVFGIASNVYHWLGFAAHAVERDKPFLSETGYRSFVAIGGTLEAGFTPESFARDFVAAHVRRALKGRLVAIKPEYRQRNEEAAS
jgi:hypothetical protein